MNWLQRPVNGSAQWQRVDPYHLHRFIVPIVCCNSTRFRNDRMNANSTFVEKPGQEETAVESAMHDIQDAIECAQIGLWRWNPRKNHVWFSEQFQQLLGYQSDETIPPTMESLVSKIHPNDQQRIVLAIDEHLANQTPYDVEYRLKINNGDYCWFRSVGKARFDAKGNPTTMAGSIVDISRQKEAELEVRNAMEELEQATAIANSMTAVAEAANMAKSEFLANMSHEIRTPMTAILGFSEILIKEAGIENAPQQRRDALEAIYRNGTFLLALINDILDMSKIEAGKMTIENVETNVPALVKDTIQLIDSRVREKNLELKWQFETPIPTIIRTDPVRLRQIIFNLLSNAIKFTEDGCITLGLEFNAKTDVLKFKVQDTGIGITADQLTKIRRFGAFSQADSTTTRKFGGTGLGLRISNSLARMLGGKLEVESNYGEGSTFMASVTTGSISAETRFVNDLNQAEIYDDRKKQAPADPQPLSGFHILVAEDGKDNQRLINFILKKAGAQVTMVENGKLAIDAVNGENEDHFDIVLMDMQMPEMDGYSATRLLRAQDYQVPIVALTAHAMASDRQKCIVAGCNDYVVKPFVQQDLFGKIVDLITRSEPRAVQKAATEG